MPNSKFKPLLNKGKKSQQKQFFLSHNTITQINNIGKRTEGMRNPIDVIDKAVFNLFTTLSLEVKQQKLFKTK